MTRATRSILAAALLLAAAPAGAGIRTFPGCGATLQLCLDGSQPGDVIQLAADPPVTVSLVVPHGLTLESAPGRRATLPDLSTLLFTSSGAAGAAVVVRDLRMLRGRMSFVQGSSGPLAVTVEDVEFAGAPLGTDPAIRIVDAQGGTGRVRFAIRRNTIRFAAPPAVEEARAISINLSVTSDPGGTVEENLIELNGVSRGEALTVFLAGTAELDVLRNTIRGSTFISGVYVSQEGPTGTLVVRAVGNLVTGHTGAPGEAAAALGFYAYKATLEVLVANNTLVGNRIGVSLSSSPEGTLRGTVANNVMADHVAAGLLIGGDPSQLVARNNLVFRNGFDTLPTGLPPLIADPRLDAALRPRADSPLRDAGATDVLPPDVRLDLAGNPRVTGDTVDIGAFELPCPDGRAVAGSCDLPPPPPACDPAACDDGDPCTEDSCGAGGCVHDALTGFATATCACERSAAAACAGESVPARVGRQQAKACTLLGCVAEAKARAARRLVRRSVSAWKAARRAAAGRRARHALTAECRTALDANLADAAGRAQGLVAR
jgi:Dictyostelium (slime mold) repeat